MLYFSTESGKSTEYYQFSWERVLEAGGSEQEVSPEGFLQTLKQSQPL